MLEDDEAIAAVLGLRLVAAGEGDSDAAEAAARAEQKVHRLLPTRLRTETEELLAAVDVAPTATGLPDVDLTASLTRAITDHVMLRFGYTSKRGTADREVEPVRLVRLQQHWYLYAWDRARSDWRTYRLDRITGRPEHGGRFVPRPLPADDLAAHLRERARGGPELTVTLVLHTSPADAASRLYRIDGTLEPLPGGVDGSRCRYTASVDSYAWLTFVLTISEVAFTVEDPEEFREYLARHAERLAKAVEGPVVFRED
jgi:predicted DNA-binding transcriptional regulator YafY